LPIHDPLPPTPPPPPPPPTPPGATPLDHRPSKSIINLSEDHNEAVLKSNGLKKHMEKFVENAEKCTYFGTYTMASNQ
jgi:hypothetical protein